MTCTPRAPWEAEHRTGFGKWHEDSASSCVPAHLPTHTSDARVSRPLGQELPPAPKTHSSMIRGSVRFPGRKSSPPGKPSPSPRGLFAGLGPLGEQQGTAGARGGGGQRTVSRQPRPAGGQEPSSGSGAGGAFGRAPWSRQQGDWPGDVYLPVRPWPGDPRGRGGGTGLRGRPTGGWTRSCRGAQVFHLAEKRPKIVGRQKDGEILRASSSVCSALRCRESRQLNGAGVLGGKVRLPQLLPTSGRGPGVLGEAGRSLGRLGGVPQEAMGRWGG